MTETRLFVGLPAVPRPVQRGLPPTATGTPGRPSARGRVEREEAGGDQRYAAGGSQAEEEAEPATGLRI